MADGKYAAQLADSRATAVLIDPDLPVDRPAIRVAIRGWALLPCWNILRRRSALPGGLIPAAVLVS